MFVFRLSDKSRSDDTTVSVLVAEAINSGRFLERDRISKFIHSAIQQMRICFRFFFEHRFYFPA